MGPGYANASNPLWLHQQIEHNPNMLGMDFRTSEHLVKKLPNKSRDPHDRIHLQKLCPKVVSDRQNAGRMASKRRFQHFRPIIENPGLNVNFFPTEPA